MKGSHERAAKLEARKRQRKNDAANQEQGTQQQEEGKA